MTYAELQTRVLGDAFPSQGPPENLLDFLNITLTAGMIEAQRWIPCLQARHDNVYASCKTFWHCGTTVITAPRGQILRAYTVQTDGWCLPVVLNPVSIGELRRWQARFRLAWPSTYFAAPASGLNLPMGFDVPNATSDSLSGRSYTGVYALDPTSKRLCVAPWLQSNESLVVEWTGIKREWAPADPVCSDEDYIRLLRLWLLAEFGRQFGAQDYGIRLEAYREALADLIVTCRQESQLHGDAASAQERSLPWENRFVATSEVTVTEDPTDVVLAFVGDTGHADASSTAVADAIEEENPDMVVLLGDTKYPPNSALVALAPYQWALDEAKVRSALGNHDLDDGHLGSDVQTLVGNPGNGRYFSFRVGPVSVFVVNSGVNTSGTMVEPDGNYVGSKQHSEIAAAILRDTGKWKIVVLHHPPYSSSTNYYPGLADVRWVTGLPVHAVLSGHAHHYERLSVANRLHLIAGTGGAELYSFRATPYPGSAIRLSAFGYLRLSATCDEATFDFIGTDGSVLDSVVLSETPFTTIPDMPADPVITVHPSSQSVEVGATITLSVTATGTAPLTYQWQKNGADIVDATNATLDVTVTEAAQYRVLVMSAAPGAVMSQAAQIFLSNSADTGYRGLAAVKAKASFRPDEVVYLLFLNTAGDGQGGEFYFDENSTATPDDYDVIKPDYIFLANPGRVVRNTNPS